MFTTLFLGLPINRKEILSRLSMITELKLIVRSSCTFAGFYLPDNPCPYTIIIKESHRLKELIKKHFPNNDHLLSVIPQVIVQTMTAPIDSSPILMKQ